MTTTITITEADVITITEADAIHGLRQAVTAAGPGHVYQSPPGCPPDTCVYAWQTAPGEFTPMCIVGRALSVVGVPLRLMYELANDEWVYALAASLKRRGYFITPDALRVLAAAQHVQDHAIPDGSPSVCAGRCPVGDWSWGAALRAALEQARRNAEQRRLLARHTATFAVEPDVTINHPRAAVLQVDTMAREFVTQVETLLADADPAPVPALLPA